MRLLFSHRSDPGLVRPSNQDSYCVTLLDPRQNAALLVVADGMGGYQGGEVASRIAVEQVRTIVQRSAADWAEKGHLSQGLVAAIKTANVAILQAKQERTGLDSMGTTITAALIWGDRIIVGHIGDSKALLVTRDKVDLITSDHSVAGELLQNGHLTEAEAAIHPQRHVLTRALGVGSGVAVELREVTWHKHDILILCTDGLTNLVSISEIAAFSREQFDQLTDRLVELANGRGGHDNITVVAARWEE